MKLPEGREANFARDYKYMGEPAEEKALELIKKHIDPNAYRRGTKGFDLVSEVIGLVEVKNGLLGRTHFALEVMDNGKPSGISTTMAGYWAILAWEKVFLIKTSVLEGLRKEYQHLERDYRITGNNKLTRIIPVPLEQIEAWSEHIWEIK